MQTTLAQFNETQTEDPFALQNGKLLKVRLGLQPVQARKGTIVAHQGEVQSEDTPEGGDLERLSGAGEVFLADRARDLHLIQLENESVIVELDKLLAFDAGIEPTVHEIEGGGPEAVMLAGVGWVAAGSVGTPVLLDVGAAPTWTHPCAAVMWAQDAEAFVEDGRVGFRGDGWVLVQPTMV